MSGEAIPIRQGSTQLMNIDIGGFRVTDAIFPPWLKLPSHYHERACFAVVLEGSVDKAFSRVAYASPPSTIVTMPPEERHRDQFECAGAHMLVVEPASASRELLRPCRGIFDRINHFRDGGIEGIAWRISRELRAPDAVSPLAITGLVLELLAMAARCYTLDEAERQPPPWLVTVREFLEASFGQSLQIADVAAVVGVHPVHLARVFRACYGLSPGDYVRRLRLDWAAIQLATSDLSLADIAQQAGFADQSHFTRLFKRHKGLPPGQYRQAVDRRLEIGD